MEKGKYWFKDNWYGNLLHFNNLREAKKAAKKQTGMSVAIRDNKGNFICHAPASEHTPS